MPSRTPHPAQSPTSDPTTLTVAGVAALEITDTADPATGSVTYCLSGPRIRGPITVGPTFTTHASRTAPAPLDPEAPRIRVLFGATDNDTDPDRPTINGVALTGDHIVPLGAVLSGELADRPYLFHFAARRFAPTAWDRPDAPPATNATAVAVAAALVTRWYERPDRAALCRAAARLAAPDYIANHLRRVDQLRSDIAELTEQLRAHERHIAAARSLTT